MKAKLAWSCGTISKLLRTFSASAFADAARDEIVDKRGDRLFLGDDASTASPCAQADSDHRSKAWAAIAGIDVRGGLIQRPAALDETPDLVAANQLHIAVGDSPVVHDQGREAAAAVLGDDPVEGAKPGDGTFSVRMGRVEAGAVDHLAVAEQVEPTGDGDERRC